MVRRCQSIMSIGEIEAAAGFVDSGGEVQPARAVTAILESSLSATSTQNFLVPQNIRCEVLSTHCDSCSVFSRELIQVDSKIRDMTNSDFEPCIELLEKRVKKRQFKPAIKFLRKGSFAIFFCTCLTFVNLAVLATFLSHRRESSSRSYETGFQTDLGSSLKIPRSSD
jgi:hypothetical protein